MTMMMTTPVFDNMTTAPVSGNSTERNCSVAEILVFLEFEKVVRIVVPTIFGFICLIGFIGNVLVIIVVVSNKKMRSTTNILIVSLAVADLFFIIFCVPFTAAGYAMTVWPFGNIWCKIVQYLSYVFAYASVYTLVLMSLDRYLAVVHPINSISYRTEKNAYFTVVTIWMIIILGNVPLLLDFDLYTYDYYCETRSACVNIAAENSEIIGKVFYGCFFTIGYVIPLALVCILYGLMLKRLLYGVVPGRGSQSAESIRSKRRVTRMVVIVVTIFGLCWLPIQVILVMQRFGTYKHNIPNLGFQMAANCLSYMNSCVNPILYAFLSDNFRRGFKKLLGCKSRSNDFTKSDYERTQVRVEECRVTATTTTSTTTINNSNCTPTLNNTKQIRRKNGHPKKLKKTKRNNLS